ncbi:hypothetical protein A500_09083 [Clostridium sartagoforme AAU1]|uniref:Uncharacterized protein n=1 Tax=Clostridium sartagoforme AAU1 TaxID=1202534 RepID=R9C9T7_9CLOT|nr:hypothetical protein A500_09083 [Clostridium sartagoforme AAU1]
MNFKYFLTDGAFIEEYFIILMNFLLLSPLILINMLYGNSQYKIKIYFKRIFILYYTSSSYLFYKG